MDLKKKKEKKKNLERQALETRRSKSKQRGSLRKSPSMRTMAAMMAMTATTPRGWRPVLTGSSRVRLGPTSTPHGREPQRGGQADLLRGNRGRHPLAAPMRIPLPRQRKVRSSRAPNLPLRQSCSSQKYFSLRLARVRTRVVRAEMQTEACEPALGAKAPSTVLVNLS